MTHIELRRICAFFDDAGKQARRVVAVVVSGGTEQFEASRWEFGQSFFRAHCSQPLIEHAHSQWRDGKPCDGCGSDTCDAGTDIRDSPFAIGLRESFERNLPIRAWRREESKRHREPHVNLKLRSVSPYERLRPQNIAAICRHGCALLTEHQVEFSSIQSRNEICCYSDFDFNQNVRVRCAKTAQYVRQCSASEILRSANPDPCPFHLRWWLEARLRLFLQIDDATGVAKKGHPTLGETYPTRRALEQRHSALRLEPAHMHANRGLGQI